MTNCPNCGRSIETPGVVCRSCGWLLKVDAAPQIGPVADTTKSPQPARVPAAKAEPPKRRHNTAAIVALLVGGVGSLILVAITRSPAAPQQTASAGTDVARTPVVSGSSRTDAGAPATAQPRKEEPAAQWIRSEQRDWRRNRPNGVTFELAADHDVAVWNKRVRPVLTIRCVSGTNEVFVTTRSAASFEPDAGLHTVRLTFDDSTGVEQKWEDSVDHDALFSRDGVAMAHRLAQARKMTFRFTPFNASPVLADFAVDGLGAHLASSGKSCGWTQ
jgi:hypothetical protein